MTTLKLKRQWLRFSLLTLLVLVAVCAILCSWLAVKIWQAKQQLDAATAIETAGGEVCWGQPLGPNGELLEPGPEWLRELLGDNFFRSVLSVNFENTTVTNADLEHLETFSQLGELWLNNTQVTDVGLKHLNGLSHLNLLRLENTPITDAGLEHLQCLKQPLSLWLDNTRITDAGLEHLQGLSQLLSLRLTGTQVTDVGLEHLKGLNRLRWLDLRNTKVTDEGVKKLRQALPNCISIAH